MGASARLFVLAACIAAGVLLAEELHLGIAGALAFGSFAALSFFVAAGSARVRAGAALMIASAGALSLGVALAGMRLAMLDRAALASAGSSGADAILDGRIGAEPETRDGALRFPLSVRHAFIDGREFRLREKVVASVRPPPKVHLGPGDLVRIDARLAPVLSPPSAATASLETSLKAAARRLRWDGIAARAYARPDGVERRGGPTSPLDRIGRGGRDAVASPVLRLPPREAGLLLGVVIGDSSRLDPRVEADFKTTGLTHLLAVSGENLVLFLGSVAFALRALRTGRRTQLVVLAAALVSFMAITRYEPSVLRAGLMGAVGLAGTALGARRETLTALAVSAIVLLVADPFIVHAIGFQLSALATLGILLLGPPLRRAFPGKLGAAAAVTLAAQLAVAPLIALTFHTVSLISLAANLVAVPAVGPATVLGVVSAPLGSVWSGLGFACVVATRPLLWWMLGTATFFARVPHASVGTPSGILGGVVVVALTVIAFRAARAKKPPRLASVVIAFAVFVATSVWANALVPPVPEGLEVIALDVGQGDAILARAGGVTMLVDGGPDPQVVLRRLAAHRVSRIDLLVLTHPHADHVIGLAGVLEAMPVGRALDPGQDAEIAAYRQYLQSITTKHIPRDLARAGMRYALGPATIDVLAPGEPLFHGTDSDLNNNSVVMRLTYGSASVLLGGELQEEAQQRLLESNPSSLDAELFKVPHHGSLHFLRAFYAATHAAAALIPVGPNDYGQPSQTCLDALSALGIRAYRTDRGGDIDAVLSSTGAMRLQEQHPT